jgi:heme-degrading monooxygenase HmoA
MIARRWTGRVPASRRDEYLVYLERTGLKDYAATPGHLGTMILRRTDEGVTEYELTTFWDSTDAIRAFAGDDISLARYYPEDEDFLLELSERVEHWEVIAR